MTRLIDMKVVKIDKFNELCREIKFFSNLKGLTGQARVCLT